MFQGRQPFVGAQHRPVQYFVSLLTRLSSLPPLTLLPHPQAKPEAQSYYQLAAASLKFKFPEPAPLDGVTSAKKSILKMLKVGFTYPGAPKKALSDVTVHVRLSSRVAVLGANGAGKSTLIKVWV